MPYPTKEVDFPKMPVFVLGSLMTFIAGYINSSMLIEFAMPVSQMTGIASRISDASIHLEYSDLLNAGMILLGFFIGAMLSGWMIGHRQYHQDRSYGYALLCVSLLLSIATLFSYVQSELSVFLAAMACGLQNALVASYRGLQIRTTHMTGIVTDLAAFTGIWLKTRAPWTWQPYLLICLLISFIVGGIIGTLVYRELPNITLIFPGIIMATLGILYLKQVSINLSTNSTHNIQ